MNPCCDSWAEAATHYGAPVGGGLLYPGSNPQAQIEQDSDGEWLVNGCCGGGCAVLTGLRFCPWCGSSRIVYKSTVTPDPQQVEG
jgi:hypothetical protein